MLDTYIYSIKILIRNRSNLIWAVAFPLVLSTLFYSMFSRLDELYVVSPIPVLVVADDNYRQAPGYAEMIESLSEPSDIYEDSALLAPTFVADEAEAREQLKSGDYYGFILVDASSQPSYFIDSRWAITLDSVISTQQGIVISIQDRYIQDFDLIARAYELDPTRFGDPQWAAELLAPATYVSRGSISANPPSDALRYYYAALAFSSMQMMCFGMIAINLWKANASALGARRATGGQGWLRSLVPTLLAAWSLAFACVFIGFLYIRFGFQASFGGKEPAALMVLAAATLVTVLLGALLAALPVSPGAKTGLIPAISCGLSIFAGLYGPASQELGDFVARAYPTLSNLNTARQVSDAFASLYYYDSYDRLFEILTVMAATAAIFFVTSIFVMRRQRYRSL